MLTPTSVTGREKEPISATSLDSWDSQQPAVLACQLSCVPACVQEESVQ